MNSTQEKILLRLTIDLNWYWAWHGQQGGDIQFSIISGLVMSQSTLTVLMKIEA